MHTISWIVKREYHRDAVYYDVVVAAVVVVVGVVVGGLVTAVVEMGSHRRPMMELPFATVPEKLVQLL